MKQPSNRAILRSAWTSIKTLEVATDRALICSGIIASDPQL